jgi:hypothetical protein
MQKLVRSSKFPCTKIVTEDSRAGAICGRSLVVLRYQRARTCQSYKGGGGLQRFSSTMMSISLSIAVLCAIFIAPVSSSLLSEPGTRILSRDDSPPIVDLGYAMYQGSTNSSTNISSFYSIRFAAPPIGEQNPHRYHFKN